MKNLKLRDGVRTTVYTMIVDALKTDPTLQGTIHPNGWRTYTGEPDIEAPAGEDTLPSIEVLPFAANAGPASIVMQESPFGIAINIATEELDVRDLLNLWETVEAALFKGDGQAKLLEKIKTALKELGEARKDRGEAGGGQIAAVSLTNPAITPAESQLNKQILVAAGTINVHLRIPR